MKKSRRPIPLFVKILLGGLGVLFLVVVINIFLFLTALDRAKGSVRGTGIATTEAEYNHLFPHTPESKKLVYDFFIFKSIVTPSDLDAMARFNQALVDPNRVSAVDWTGLNRILQTNSNNLIFLDSASRIARASTNDTQHRNQSVLQAAHKQAVQLLCVKAVSQWQFGKRLESLESIRKAAVISDQMSRSPSILPMLVSVSCFQTTFRSLRIIIRNGALTVDEKRKLAEIESIFRDAPAYSVYLKGEPYDMEMLVASPPIPLPPGGSKFREVIGAEYYLRNAKYLQATKTSLPNSFEYLAVLRKTDAEYKSKYSSSINPIEKLAGMAFVEISKTYTAYLKRIVFADFINYVLTGKKGTDPYCGTDYGRIMGAKETTIYSVGPDGKDDGGSVYGEKAPDVGITFRVN